MNKANSQPHRETADVQRRRGPPPRRRRQSGVLLHRPLLSEDRVDEAAAGRRLDALQLLFGDGVAVLLQETAALVLHVVGEMFYYES